MSYLGQDVIDIGSTKIGQDYVLGASVPLNNPSWQGPWDCAEFTSWAAYQAYGLIFGAGTTTSLTQAEPYSGYWFADAKKRGTLLDWREALDIPGAVLIRAPGAKIGHVAFSMGDSDRTLEARGAMYGVGIFDGAEERAWSIGCLLPGVDYGTKIYPAKEVKPAEFPKGYLWLKKPAMKGPEIVALQVALKTAGFDGGPTDGVFGQLTEAAVASAQAKYGIEVDGVVGPHTAKALGLAFPIIPSGHDVSTLELLAKPAPISVDLPKIETEADVVIDVSLAGQHFKAKTKSGFEFVIGKSTPYTDDMHRYGLMQDSTALKAIAQFGSYDAADYVDDIGKWAHFIEPTLLAEGAARFAALNTYDRAAFTFGAPQLAAHTPNANFVEYFRKILALEGASAHFPELALKNRTDGKTTIHVNRDGDFVDLEVVVAVKRPNGKTENQLERLMTYLNPSPTKVDAAELSASARLINWLRLEPKVRDVQIEVFVAQAKKNLARAKDRVDGLEDQSWPAQLWVMDCLHQGRGSFTEMSAAMKAASPEQAMMQLGFPKYRSRIKSVDGAIAQLKASGVLEGFNPL